MENKYYFDGVLASYIAIRLEPIVNGNFSGIELEILEKIYASFHNAGKTISIEKIAEIEGLPESSVKYVVNSLSQKGLIKPGSDWQTTKEGDKVIDEAKKIYKESKEYLQSDKLMSTVITVSGTKIEF